MIHRDLKPHNVIVDDDDHVKVTDFGIARAGASDMTETGSIMGTAQYLSPEQAQGHAVSAPSDLYSVGIVLYEMLTGRVPFDGESPVAIALKHVSEAPVPPSQFNPAIPLGARAGRDVVAEQGSGRPARRRRPVHHGARAGARVAGGSAGEITASMRAVGCRRRAGAGRRVRRRRRDARVEAAGAYGGARRPGASTGTSSTAIDDDDQHDRGKSPDLAVAGRPGLVLLLIGGGVAAYLLTRPKKVLRCRPSSNLRCRRAQTRLQSAGFVPNAIYEPLQAPQTAS